MVAQTSSELTRRINDEMKKAHRQGKKELPKYEYPPEVVTAAMLQRYANHGWDFQISESDCVPIYALDAQREQKKSIFGGGLLLSPEKAAEHQRILEQWRSREEEEVKVWPLSEREKEISKNIGKNKGK